MFFPAMGLSFVLDFFSTLIKKTWASKSGDVGGSGNLVGWGRDENAHCTREGILEMDRRS